MTEMAILKVAVPSPLYRAFDYRLEPAVPVSPGVRVRVPFGRRRVVGVVLEVAKQSELPIDQLKRVEAVLDETPLWSVGEWRLLLWASRYYQHPVGEVLHAALPAGLRRGQAARTSIEPCWRLTAEGAALTPDTLARAPRQAVLHRTLRDSPAGAGSSQLAKAGGSWRGALRAMVEKGWVEAFEREPHSPVPEVTADAPTLNAQQGAVLAALEDELGRYGVHLLEGVTGSGKTEVYLRLIERVASAGRQALVLVPEIGLTPQLVARFRQRLAVELAVLHSGLSDRERLDAWLAARSGRASVVIGTRSAIFTPLAAPGLIVVDEEHDTSYKQQEGFRYHARDLAVLRARYSDVPIVLGSATPSLESLSNAERGRYRLHRLPERAGAANHPAVTVVDVRRQPMEEGLASPLLGAVEETLAAGDQVLLFLNRRGYAPALVCHDCGWVAECRRCDAPLTLHRGRDRLCCHHCGAERPVDERCEECRSEELRPAGRGTERVEEALKARFPQVPILRIDRDTTRRRGALEARLAKVHEGSPCVLVGTQMLAKGHHFPNVTLVALLNVDQGLYSSDFRAAERLAQLIVQVSGRAGRAAKPGRVLIQTHHPDHPLLQRLIRDGYNAFSREALAERREAGFPPYTALALIRAEATEPRSPHRFLEEVHRRLSSFGRAGVSVWGPVPAPMERRAGRYRAHLLLQCPERGRLQAALGRLVPELDQLPGARKVRWSVDVDPQELV
ncbi:MAG: primosomal protein N' [Gammaproteobacteria bacterium]